MTLEIISRSPGGRPRPTPLLFVHGMMHGAWCWDAHFLGYFARHGFAAHAVNLRGHGASDGRERLRWTRIADFVADVENALGVVGSPSVLIGHSMGGFVVQKYLERHDAPGAVLLSSPPPSGLWWTLARIARRSPLVLARTNLTLSLQPFIARPEFAREAFFSPAVPDADLMTYWRLMQDESYRALLDMTILDLPKPRHTTTPLLVLGASRDRMLTPREIKATGGAWHTRSEIVPGVAHDSMLEPGWEAVAERILRWLEERVEPAR